MTHSKKLRGCILLGVILSGVIIMYINSDTISADTEMTTEKESYVEEVTSNSLSEKSSESNSKIRDVDIVTNTSGIKAKAKPLILEKNSNFPDLNTEVGRGALFSELIIPDTQEGVSYEYVNLEGNQNEPSSSETGFQQIYVKITENQTGTRVIIPIPVTITDTDTTLLLGDRVALEVSTTDGKVITYPNELENKSTEQLKETLKNNAKSKAWDTETGEEVPVYVSGTTINSSIIGMYKVDFEVILGSGSEEQRANIQKDVLVFGATVNTTKYLSIGKNKELLMGTDAANIFSAYQTVSSTTASNATYEWVADQKGKETQPANKFDASKTGLQWGYIKMIDKSTPSISTIIPIPVTVTAEDRSVIIDSKVGLSNNQPFLKVSDIKDKTPSQISDLLVRNLEISAWNLKTGEVLKVGLLDSTIDENSRGTQDITVTIFFGKEILTYKLVTWIVPDEVFANDTSNDWETVSLNTADGVITNPINQSKIGFPNRGLTDRYSGSPNKSDLGYIIQDKNNVGMLEEGARLMQTPLINGTSLYKSPYGGASLSSQTALGNPFIDKNIQKKVFLRKGNELKEILYDQSNQVIYVYKISVTRNLNFLVMLEMYNLSKVTKRFGMLESGSLAVRYVSGPPNLLYSSGNNSGFYFKKGQSENNPESRMSIKLKGSRGNWLSDYTKYWAGYWLNSAVQYSISAFGSNMLGNGTESRNLPKDQIIASGSTAFQLGAPYKNIPQDAALKVGYEIFVGSELPYMNIKANPEIKNVYSDEEITYDYKLSGIPNVNDSGTVYLTYPNGEEETQKFIGNTSKEFDGKFTINKNKLLEPKDANKSIPISYKLSLSAINESDGPMKGLPSQEDYDINLNIYTFGGTPIGQVVRKNSTWNKNPSTLIKDAVVLPGRTATFEYVNEEKPLDTSRVGFQYIDVRMTDNNEPARTVIIKVPIMVIDGPIPTTGLMLGAYDIAAPKNEVNDLTSEQLNEFILKKSQSVAWDVTDGLSKDVELSVIETSLTNTPDISKTYTATIQAKKGTLITKKTIKMNFGARLTANFLDENGNSIIDDYAGIIGIGDSVDLSKITEINDSLTKLNQANYDLVKKPDEEIFIMDKNGKSVVYQFNGSLTILSAPSALDFETRVATINAQKITEPKIVGKPLVVSDTRADKLKWSLKAKIDKPLTSLEYEGLEIPDAIQYHYKENELTLSEESVVIFDHLNSASGNVDITKERWANGDGFALNLVPGAIKALGKYQAKITITLENAK